MEVPRLHKNKEGKVCKSGLCGLARIFRLKEICTPEAMKLKASKCSMRGWKIFVNKIGTHEKWSALACMGDGTGTSISIISVIFTVIEFV